MPSKLVLARLGSARNLIALAHEREAALASSFSGLLGLPEANAVELIRALSGKLEEAITETAEAETARQTALCEDASMRQTRDRAARKTAATLLALRKTVGAVFGEASVRALNLDGPIPGEPTPLESLGSAVLQRLATWEPPEDSRLEGLSLDREKLQAMLSPAVSELASSISAVALRKRQAFSSHLTKQRAIERSDRMFILTANVLRALFEAAGDEQLARSVRPSKRRRGLTVCEEGSREKKKPPEPPAGVK